MGDNKWRVCAVFSGIATVLLSALGLALVNGYEYVPVTGVDNEQAALTCFYAAGIYGLMSAGSAYLALRNQRTVVLIPPSSQLLEMRVTGGSTPQIEV